MFTNSLNNALKRNACVIKIKLKSVYTEIITWTGNFGRGAKKLAGYG